MMTLKETIQDRIKKCMKDGLADERDVLRTVLGEAQTRNLNSTDDDILKILKKSRENCLDTIQLIQDEDKIASFKKEIDIYEGFLPQTLSFEQVVKQLSESIREPIELASSDGQGIGVAMGFFKKNDIAVDGKDVAQVVKSMRNGVQK